MWERSWLRRLLRHSQCRVKAAPSIRPPEIQLSASLLSEILFFLSFFFKGVNTKTQVQGSGWNILCLFNLFFPFCLFLFSLFFFFTVWQNGGDRQHAEPRLCSQVHLGLLFRGETEPSLWLVSAPDSGCITLSSPLLHPALLHRDVLWRPVQTESPAVDVLRSWPS